MESMGVASGCGCKEVYPYFLLYKKNVFRSCTYHRIESVDSISRDGRDAP